MAAHVKIADLNFEIFKIPMLQRLKLDRRVAKMLLPLISGLDAIKMDSLTQALSPDLSEEEVEKLESSLTDSLDFSRITQAVSKALGALSDEEFMSLIRELLEKVSCIHPKQGAMLLDSDKAIELVLNDLSTLDVYQLAIAVMRENKFAPFALIAGGSGILQTVTSAMASATKKKSGLKLGTSED